MLYMKHYNYVDYNSAQTFIKITIILKYKCTIIQAFMVNILRNVHKILRKKVRLQRIVYKPKLASVISYCNK